MKLPIIDVFRRLCSVLNERLWGTAVPKALSATAQASEPIHPLPEASKFPAVWHHLNTEPREWLGVFFIFIVS